MFEGEVALDSESFSEATDESVEEMLLLDELTELLSESSLLDDSLDALDSLEELLDVFFAFFRNDASLQLWKKSAALLMSDC